MKTLFYRSRSERELKRVVKETAMEGKPLSIMDDGVFKAMLTADNEDSREALRSLLSDCTHRQVSKVQVVNNEPVRAHPDVKAMRLDVNVIFNDGEAANLEMQMSASDDNLKDRAALHTAVLQARQQSRGRYYYEVKRVYQIFFLNCELFPDSDRLPRRYSYREEQEHDRLTEATEIIFYELPKLERKVKNILNGTIDIGCLSEEEKWCIFMKYWDEEQTQPFIKELCQKEEKIMRAERAVQGVSRSYLRSIREMNIIKNDMDHNTRSFVAGRKEGREEGRAEGHAKTLEIARKMKEMGDSIEKIHAVTGLSFETIEPM